MLRVLGSPRRFCDGWARREFIQAGALGALGLGDWLRAEAARPAEPMPASFGKAKACILLYLYGSPSQLETFDVKPDAPVGIRGDLGSIATAIPGFRVGELLPQTAKVIDRATVVRSMTHPYPVHGVAYATTGLPDPVGTREVTPRDPAHWPFFGSVVDYLEERRARRQAACHPAQPRPALSVQHAAAPTSRIAPAHTAAFWALLSTPSGPSSRARARMSSRRKTAGSSSSSAIPMRVSSQTADSRCSREENRATTSPWIAWTAAARCWSSWTSPGGSRRRGSGPRLRPLPGHGLFLADFQPPAPGPRSASRAARGA